MVDKQVKKAIDRANRLSEEWAGTTAGSIIDYRKSHLEDLLKTGDMNLVSVQLIELVQACNDVEQELSND